MMGSFLVACLALSLVSPVQDADALATQLLEAGADDFSNKDTAAMVNSYTPDARITVVMQSETGIEEHSYEGRESIRKLYSDLFSNAGAIQSKNVVEYARLIGPDLLLIAGTFEPDLAGPTTLQFVQLRIRQEDGTWLIRDMRLIPLP